MMYDAKKDETKTMVSITGPDGSVGTWLLKTNASMICSAIGELSRLLKNDYQGFTVSSTECSRFVPESIKCIDADLTFINPEWCIRKDSGTSVMKNEGLLSRVCCECIRNASYKDFIHSWAAKANTPAAHIVENTVVRAYALITGSEKTYDTTDVGLKNLEHPVLIERVSQPSTGDTRMFMVDYQNPSSVCSTEGNTDPSMNYNYDPMKGEHIELPKE